MVETDVKYMILPQVLLQGKNAILAGQVSFRLRPSASRAYWSLLQRDAGTLMLAGIGLRKHRHFHRSRPCLNHTTTTGW